MNDFVKVGQIEFGDIVGNDEKYSLLQALKDKGCVFCEDKDYSTATYIIMKEVDNGGSD